MKNLDKETITILFCWLQLGLLASFCLWKFAEIPFLHSVGFTAPRISRRWLFVYLVIGQMDQCKDQAAHNCVANSLCKRPGSDLTN